MRPCSNPARCAFGTAADEHQTMTARQADELNEQITAEQVASEGFSAFGSTSVSAPAVKERPKQEHPEIAALDTRLAGYHQENALSAVKSAHARLDALNAQQVEINESHLRDVVMQTTNTIDSTDQQVNASIAEDYQNRFTHTLEGNEDAESRLKAAKLSSVFAAKAMLRHGDTLRSRRAELAEQDSARAQDPLYSDKERRIEATRSQLHSALAKSGLHDYRATAHERENAPFNTRYRDGNGDTYPAKEVKLPDAIVDVLTSRGFPVQRIYELDSTPDAAQLYRSKALEFKKDNPFHASLTVYDAEKYEGQRIFMSEDGHSGFVLKDTGDGTHNEVVTVFSTKSAPKGAAYQMMAQSVGEGGSKLDCYNTVLPSIYSSVGFREYDYRDWDDQYKPDDWDYDTYSSYNNGRPGIVLMEWSEDYEPARSIHDTRSTEDRASSR